MLCKIFFSLLSLTLITGTVIFARAQQNEDENVRGAFLTSRPSGSAANSPKKSTGTRRKKARRTGTAKSTNQSVSENRTKTAADVGTNNSSVMPKSLSTAPIGLGYTLYARDTRGDAVRVDPAREFHAGDRIRLSLESNTDGYLYVFHTENDGEPEMIFPDARLNEGDNAIDAHVPYEVPSSAESDERLRWFTFDQNPANERLYIVVTREPLPAVPTGEELMNYCRAHKSRCPWRPLPAIWTELRAVANARVAMNKSRTYGQAQTASEREATTRGLGLRQGAPEPSVIRMNVSSSTGILVTALDLIHK